MLIHQLRESHGYLADAGWSETAKLMLLAADEIERLTAQLAARRSQSPLASEASASSAKTSARVAALR